MNKVKLMVVVAAPFVIAACGNDANTPASVEEQAKAVRGSKPTSEQLATAMKDYKGLAAPPPAGGPGGPGADKGTGTPPPGNNAGAPKG